MQFAKCAESRIYESRAQHSPNLIVNCMFCFMGRPYYYYILGEHKRTECHFSQHARPACTKCLFKLLGKGEKFKSPSLRAILVDIIVEVGYKEPTKSHAESLSEFQSLPSSGTLLAEQCSACPQLEPPTCMGSVLVRSLVSLVSHPRTRVTN